MGFLSEGGGDKERRPRLERGDKKLGHLGEVFCGKGFRGHVVCNVMFAYLPLRVREILTEERDPPLNLQPCSLSAFHSSAHSPGHASQQPTQAAANQRASNATLTLTSLPFRNASFFIPPRRPLKEGAGSSPLPHWPLSHRFSKQALTRIKEYHH